MPGNSDIGSQAVDSLHPVFPGVQFARRVTSPLARHAVSLPRQTGRRRVTP